MKKIVFAYAVLVILFFLISMTVQGQSNISTNIIDFSTPQISDCTQAIAHLSQIHRAWQRGDWNNISVPEIQAISNCLSQMGLTHWQRNYFQGVLQLIHATVTNPIDNQLLNSAVNSFQQALQNQPPPSYENKLHLLLGISFSYKYQIQNNPQNFNQAIQNLNVVGIDQIVKPLRSQLVLRKIVNDIRNNQNLNIILSQLNTELRNITTNWPGIPADYQRLILFGYEYLVGTLSNNITQRDSAIAEALQYYSLSAQPYQNILSNYNNICLSLHNLGAGNRIPSTLNTCYSNFIQNLSRIGTQDIHGLIQPNIPNIPTCKYPNFMRNYHQFLTSFNASNQMVFNNQLAEINANLNHLLGNDEYESIQFLVLWLQREIRFWRMFSGGGFGGILPPPQTHIPLIERFVALHRNIIQVVNGRMGVDSNPIRMRTIHYLIVMRTLWQRFNSFGSINYDRVLSDYLGNLAATGNARYQFLNLVYHIAIQGDWNFSDHSALLNQLINDEMHPAVQHDARLFAAYQGGAAYQQNFTIAGSWFGCALYHLIAGAPIVCSGAHAYPWYGLEWYYLTLQGGIGSFLSGFPVTQSGQAQWPPSNGVDYFLDWNMSYRGALLSFITNYPSSIRNWKAWFMEPLVPELPYRSAQHLFPLFSWINDGVELGNKASITLAGLPPGDKSIIIENSTSFSTKDTSLQVQIPSFQDVQIRLEMPGFYPFVLNRVFYGGEVVNLNQSFLREFEIDQNEVGLRRQFRGAIVDFAFKDNQISIITCNDSLDYFLESRILDENQIGGETESPVSLSDNDILPNEIYLDQNGDKFVSNLLQKDNHYSIIEYSIDGSIKSIPIHFMPLAMSIYEDSLIVAGKNDFESDTIVCNMEDRTEAIPLRTNGIPVKLFAEMDSHLKSLIWTDSQSGGISAAISDAVPMDWRGHYFLVCDGSRVLRLIDCFGNEIQKFTMRDAIWNLDPITVGNRYLAASRDRFYFLNIH